MSYTYWDEKHQALVHACTADDIDPKDLEKCPRCGLRQEMPICCPKCGWCEHGVELWCPECIAREEETWRIVS